MSTKAEIIDNYFQTKNYYAWIPYSPIGKILVEEVERQGENGLYLSTACALVEKESGGKNIFGCDWGSKWTNVPPYCQVAVTKDRVQKLIENVKAGGGQNGVGYTQLTTISYVYEAEKMGGAHLPSYQMRVGFRVLLEHIANLGWPAGAAAYNAGAGNWRSVINTYGASMKRLEREWAARLANATDKPTKPTQPMIRPYAKIWTKTREKAESIARNHRKRGREAEVGEEPVKEEEMSKVKKGLAKALEFRGIKYGYWTWQRNFVLWADAIPTLTKAREIGGVCSSVPNVYRLINGMSTPAPAGKLKGGTGAWFAAHAHHRLQNINQVYEAGTLFMSDYRGEAVDKQGHVAVAGETGVNPWLCQSDTGLGWNDKRRLRDTQAFANFTHFAKPGEWLG